MKKRDPYRFSVKLDEDDSDHQVVADYLNGFGRKKARIIVKAVLAYLEMEREKGSDKVAASASRIEQEKPLEDNGAKEKAGRMLQLDMNYSMDEAEIALMRRNYDKLGKEG